MISRNISVIALATILLPACSTTQKQTPKQPDEPALTRQNTVIITTPKTAPNTPTAREAADTVIVKQRPTITAVQVERTLVLFPYDSDNLDTEAHHKLKLVANYMKHHPKAKLLIKGHADERGSAEYNLALGEDRAAAARKILSMHGIDARRLVILSYGEEQPLIDRDTRQAYRFNRRVDFSVQKNQYSQK